MTEREVIEAFVAHLRKDGHPDLEIDDEPDKRNRETADIDAVAGEFAIEHTSIDRLEDQRGESARFKRVCGDLEERCGDFDFRLRLIFDYDSLDGVLDLDAIHEALAEWLDSDYPRKLLYGVSRVEIEGVPFELQASKSQSERPGVRFWRSLTEPDDSLPERVRELLDKKMKKLKPYHRSGRTTIILVENDDIALMNQDVAREAIRASYPNGPPAEIDQIWYADTSIPDEPLFYDFTPDIS